LHAFLQESDPDQEDGAMDQERNRGGWDRNRTEGSEELERRLMEEGREGRQELIDSAIDASELDRDGGNDPEQASREAGADDPRHSPESNRRRT
jgi:hypothetical protein